MPAFNAAFGCVWDIGSAEVSFNAIERMFFHPRARRMHADHFVSNIAPVIAMLQSAIGRRPQHQTLRRLRERILAEEPTRRLWNSYEISDPLIPNRCTIESPVGTFTYDALTLANPGETSGMVIQIPDQASRTRLLTGMVP